MSVVISEYGKTCRGETVQKAVLENGTLKMEVLSLGGIIQRLWVPGRSGQTDVVLGYPEIEGYEKNTQNVGVLVGRNCNRIGGAAFRIDGEWYHVTANEGKNQLHGGVNNFTHKVFQMEQTGECEICLTCFSADGEEGFPGNLTLKAYYGLEGNDLKLRYVAEADRPTPANFTHHSYFNLNGHQAGNVEKHLLTVRAERFTPSDAENIPTGELRPVEGTALDFRTEKPLGRGIDDPYLSVQRGYDHNYVLDGEGLRLAAELTGDLSGIRMDVLTTQPGMQLYTANWLDSKTACKDGACYGLRDAVCLETQFFPDAPNHPEWGDCFLRPGKQYDQTTIYRFHSPEA